MLIHARFISNQRQTTPFSIIVINCYNFYISISLLQLVVYPVEIMRISTWVETDNVIYYFFIRKLIILINTFSSDALVQSEG